MTMVEFGVPIPEPELQFADAEMVAYIAAQRDEQLKAKPRLSEGLETSDLITWASRTAIITKADFDHSSRAKQTSHASVYNMNKILSVTVGIRPDPNLAKYGYVGPEHSSSGILVDEAPVLWGELNDGRIDSSKLRVSSQKIAHLREFCVILFVERNRLAAANEV